MLQNTPKGGFVAKNSVALIPWWLFPRFGGEFLADEESLLELTTAHLNIGMRGVPVGTCRTSFVTPTEGVHYCGYPISELAMMSPEDIIYLLFNKELPNIEQSVEFREDLQSRANFLPEWKKFLQPCPETATQWIGSQLAFTHWECSAELMIGRKMR